MATTLPQILDRILDCRYFHPDEALDGDTAIPLTKDAGSASSRLVLVQGENAGGKSFFRRLLQAVASKKGDTPVEEVIHLSMEGRTDTGMSFAPIARAIIYGDEDHFATGDLTIGTIKGAIKSASDRKHSVIVYWDEPDIGLAAASCAGVGNHIREFVDNLPSHIVAVFVTSHSPILVNKLLKAKEKPHYFFLGSDKGPATAADWVQAQMNLDIEPRDPDEISKAGHARFQKIQKILNDKKK